LQEALLEFDKQIIQQAADKLHLDSQKRLEDRDNLKDVMTYQLGKRKEFKDEIKLKQY
jgi:hypothetical protein